MREQRDYEGRFAAEDSVRRQVPQLRKGDETISGLRSGGCLSIVFVLVFIATTVVGLW